MEPIDLADVTVRELWDAIARVDCESVCPGILIDKIRRAIYENRMFGDKDLKIMREMSDERGKKLTPYFTPPDMGLVGKVTRDIFKSLDKKIKTQNPD